MASGLLAEAQFRKSFREMETAATKVQYYCLGVCVRTCVSLRRDGTFK